MSNCFIILAAGKSNRFISKIPKPYIKYKGDILINHSINKAILSKKFSKIVVAINKGHKKYIKKQSKNKVHFIEGGKSRADSSRLSLKYLSKFKPKNVLIHDAARPNFSIKLVNKLFKNLKKFDKTDIQNSSKISKNAICLPCHDKLNDNDKNLWSFS